MLRAKVIISGDRGPPGKPADVYLISRSRKSPPASPADGDAYLVPEGATGAWAGLDGKVVRWFRSASSWAQSAAVGAYIIGDEDAVMFLEPDGNTVILIKTDDGNSILTMGDGNLATFGPDVSNNVLVGFDIMPNGVTADSMTAVGNQPLLYVTDGRAGVAVGHVAGQSMGGPSNTALGAFAMRGMYAYHQTDQGPDLPLIGSGLADTGTGGRNTVSGEAAAIVATGDFSGNCAYGYNALFSSLDSINNVAIGVSAGQFGSHLESNVLLGLSAYRFGSGTGNVFAGASAGLGDAAVRYLTAPSAVGDTVVFLSASDFAAVNVGDAFWIPSATWNYMVVEDVNATAGTVTVSNLNFAQADAGTAVLTNITTGAVLYPTNGSSVNGDSWNNPGISTGPTGWNVGDTVTSTAFAGTKTVTRVVEHSTVELDGNSDVTTAAGAFLYNLSGAAANGGVAPGYPVSDSTLVGSNIWQFSDTSPFHVGDVVYATDYVFSGTTIRAKNAGDNSVTLSTPLYNDTTSGTFGYHLIAPHVGNYNVGIGFSAMQKISGEASFNIGIGFKPFGLTAITGDNNIWICKNGAPASADIHDTLNFGNRLIATGINSPSAAKFAVGNVNAATTVPGYTWDVQGTLGVSGLSYRSAEDEITAHAGGGKSNAYQLSKTVNRVSVCASDGDSVKLPTSAAGLELLIINDTSKSLQVFANNTATINNIAANTGIAQAAGVAALYFCAAAGKWWRLVSA